MRILGFKLGGKTAKKVQTNPNSVTNFRQQVNKLAFRAFLENAQEDPRILRSYAFKLMGMKEPSIKDSILEQELASNPELRRRYVEAELSRKGLESNNPFEQYMQMQQFINQMGGGRQPTSSVDKLIDGVSTLLGTAIEAGGMEAAVGAYRAAQEGSKRGGGVRVRDVSGGSDRSLGGAQSNNTSVKSEDSNKPDNTVVNDDINNPPASMSEALGMIVNNFIVMMGAMVDGSTEHTADRVAEYVVFGLNAIGRECPDNDPAYDNLLQIWQVIQDTPENIYSMLSLLSMRNKDLRPLVKKLKTPEGLEIIREICTERDIILNKMREQVQGE